MSKTLEIIKALSEPTVKLMDMVGSAIGTAYEPRHKRKMADATAYEISVIGDAMRNAADLPVLYNQEGVVINSDDFNRLMQRAGTRLALQETIKQHNIESVIDNAYEVLEKEDVCSEEPVEQGWINRFFDSVADVSDEDLQNLWGKILAGEIKKPGTFSLRTLETIRNLSQKEAEKFQKIISLGFKFKDCVFIPQNSNILEKYGVEYLDLLKLDESGLISVKPNTGITVSSFEEPFGMYSKNFFVQIKELRELTSKLTYGVYSLTSVGCELYSMLDSKSDYNFTVDLLNDIIKTNMNIKIIVELFEILGFNNDGSMTYKKIPIYTRNTDEV